MSEWQPIETAPKDGTDVLIHLGDGRPPVVAGFFPPDDDSDPIQNWWQEYDSINNVRGTPTHWMPLPEPPKSSEAS